MQKRPILWIFVLTTLIQTFLVLNPNTQAIATSNIEFSEIMYDLEGSDTDREWIEIFNAKGSTVDLSNWRLEENGTEHTLTIRQGAAQLEDGTYAVIADNFDKFKEDYPNYTGIVFDSSFSLSNTGETLKLLESAGGLTADEITYSESQGAKGDKNSLQKKGNSWEQALPTPGKENNSQAAPSPSPSPSPQSTTKSPSPTPSTQSTTKSPSPSPSPKNTQLPKTTPSSNTQNGNQILGTSAQTSSPTPSPTHQAQTSGGNVSKTKIAAMVSGSGLILLGLSTGLYLWYSKNLGNPKKEKSVEEQKQEEDLS